LLRLPSAGFLIGYSCNSDKIAIYKAICISILLYGCESWTPYRRHIKTLEVFHIRCLKSIHWWHKVTHVEISHRAADIDSAEHLLLQRQLRWVGHVIRMPSNRLPRRILYGESVNGQRLPGGPKFRYMHHIHCILNKCNICPSVYLSDSCLDNSRTEKPRKPKIGMMDHESTSHG